MNSKVNFVLSPSPEKQMNPEKPNSPKNEEPITEAPKAEADSMDFELPAQQEGSSCYVGCDVCQ